MMHSGADDPLWKLFLSDYEKGCFVFPKDGVLSYLAQMKEESKIKDYTSTEHFASLVRFRFRSAPDREYRVYNRQEHTKYTFYTSQNKREKTQV